MKFFALTVLLSSSIVFANGQRRISSVAYAHDLVGVAAQVALATVSIDVGLRGWRVCHDAASAGTWLAVSQGADPAIDGVRVAPGQCFECDDCGSKGLIGLNVKADAAATGYSVLQFL